MQDKTEIDTSAEVLRPLVIRSLRGSSIRKKIAEYLFEISPSGSYVSEIAYHVETAPSNVIGALRGMNSRYRQTESLIDLNIVEQIKRKDNTDIKLYRITDFGKEILESIKTKR
jgi:predicted transcriptional regulator with HTH domain